MAGEMVLYLASGGRVVDMENGCRKYEGGTSKPFWISKEFEINDLVRKVEECMGDALRGKKIWYSMKFDRGIILPLESPMDVINLKKGNDDHGFLFVGVDGVCNLSGGEGSNSGVRIENNAGEKDSDPSDSRRCNATDDARWDGIDGELMRGEASQLGANLNQKYGYDVNMGGGVHYVPEVNVVACSRSGLEAEEYKRRLMIWQREIHRVGQLFPDAVSFRIAIFKYALANRFQYKFKRNCRARVSVVCVADGCEFQISAVGGRGKAGMVVNHFKPVHTHSIGEQCSMGACFQRKMGSKLLGSLIESKVKVDPKYTPVQILKEIELELDLNLTYKQCWRAKEYARMMIAGCPDDHYKLLPWLCASICRSNPNSRAFCELEGCRFLRMFVCYGASIQGFINGCRKMLFVDGCFLTADFGGTLLGAVALDANNHLFDVAYAVVDNECKEEWTWFMQNLSECLGGLKPVIMSDRENGLVAAVAEIFGGEYQSYCARHLKENLMSKASSLGICSTESREKLKNSFNRILYAATNQEYDIALQALRSSSRELADWVVLSKPEHWAVSKFPFQRWGIVDNNPAESWNNQMNLFRSLPIPSLLIGHHLKLGANFDEKRADVGRWKNGVGKRVEKKLTEINTFIGCVVQIRMFDRDAGEYAVYLSNGRWLRVMLSERTCSYKAWQLEGIPCCHAMAVINKTKRKVYDFVDPYYKEAAQRAVYANKIHPFETHDSASLDINTGMVVGGEGLDNASNRNILPPINGRPRGRPKRKRIESQILGSQGGYKRKCSRCGQGGHYRNTCGNPRVAVDLREQAPRLF